MEYDLDSLDGGDDGCISKLENELAAEELYKIFLTVPMLEKYLQVNNPGTMTFLDGFLDYFNQSMCEQDVLFAEDEPRRLHQFSQNDNVMFVALVPPDMVICIDGHLMLKREQLILPAIVGAYLFKKSDQFFTNAVFSARKIKDWLSARQMDA